MCIDLKLLLKRRCTWAYQCQKCIFSTCSIVYIFLRAGAMKINAATSHSSQEDLEVKLRKFSPTRVIVAMAVARKKTARTILPATDEN